MSQVGLVAVAKKPVEKKTPNKSKRSVLADKIRKEIPLSLGRKTTTLSNTYVIKIGKTHGIRGKDERRQARGGKHE